MRIFLAVPDTTHASSGEADQQLAVGEVATILGVHVQTIRRWADEGYLPFTKFGPHGYRRFWRSDVERVKALHEGRDVDDLPTPRAADAG